MAEDVFRFTPEQQRVVHYFERSFVPDPAAFVSAIDRRCQMYSHGFTDPERDPGATFTYFDSALKMLHPLRELAQWRFGGLARVDRLLDFASGFGRLTRFLVQELPASSIVVSDIQAEAVEFQRRAFGVEGLVSVTDPAKLRWREPFDCIFVASLFTHLPERRFRGWLAKLMSLLTPRGMLVFSVHGESLLTPHREMARSGIDFDPNVSEVASLAGAEYGSTFVSASFVDRAIQRASRGKGSYHRLPRGLWHQDLYVYTCDGAAAADAPSVGILGPQEIIAAQGRRLPAWFLETDPARRVVRAELVSDGRVLETSDSTDGTVSFAGDARFLPGGWQAPLNVVFTSVPADVFGEHVTVRATSDAGASRTFPIWPPQTT